MNSKSFATRRRLRGLAILAALVLLLVVALPTLLTQRLVYRPLLAAVDASGNSLQVGSIEAGWMTPLRIEQLVVTDPEDNQMIAVPSVRTDVRLLDLLLFRRSLGRVVLVDPVVDVRLFDSSSNVGNLAKAIRPEDTAEPRRAPAIDVDIDVRNLVVVARDVESEQTLWRSQGTHFVLQYRAAGNDQRITMRDATLLDHAPLTERLLDLGLQYALPTLHEAGDLEGEVSIFVTSCDIPFAAPGDGTIEGVITLHSAKATARSALATGIVDTIASAAGRRLPHAVVFADQSEVAFRLRDRVVWHEGMRFGLPEVDSRLQFASSGTVGLDRTLDLQVEVPLPIEWIARRDAVAEMGVPRVTLPVTGTLGDPHVEWLEGKDQFVRIAAEVLRRRREDTDSSGQLDATTESPEAVLVEEGIDAVGSLLEAIRDRRRPVDEDRETEPRRDDAPPRAGLLRGLLRDRSAPPPPADAPPRESF